MPLDIDQKTNKRGIITYCFLDLFLCYKSAETHPMFVRVYRQISVRRLGIIYAL